MDSDGTLKEVREACQVMADHIGEKMLYDDYNDMLKKESASRFPGVPRMEHVIHWVLFGAGFDVGYEGTYGNSVAYVCRNSFDPELIEKGIERYNGHITNLASLASR